MFNVYTPKVKYCITHIKASSKTSDVDQMPCLSSHGNQLRKSEDRCAGVSAPFSGLGLRGSLSLCPETGCADLSASFSIVADPLMLEPL